MDEIERMTRFGEFIADRRKELGLSQEEVGDVFGMTRQNIGNIEKGKSLDFQMSTFRGLAKALKLNPLVLFDIYINGKNAVDGLSDFAIGTNQSSINAQVQAMRNQFVHGQMSMFETMKAFSKLLSDEEILELIQGREAEVLKQLDRMDEEDRNE